MGGEKLGEPKFDFESLIADLPIFDVAINLVHSSCLTTREEDSGFSMTILHLTSQSGFPAILNVS